MPSRIASSVGAEQPDTLTSTGRSLQAEIRGRRAALSAYRTQAIAPFSLEQTVIEGVALTARMLRAERCAVARLVENYEGLLLCAGIGWHAEVVGRGRMAVGTGTLGRYALEHHGPIIVEDLTLFTEFHIDPLLAEHGVVSALMVPIWPQSEPYRLLGAYSSVRRLFSPMDVEFVQGVAGVMRAADYRDRWRHGRPLPRRRSAPTEW